MKVVVQKFGGSSVATVEKIRAVAQKIAARRVEGNRLVIVVSAMGDTTDDLLKLAKQLSDDPPRRELDMLLTCGERISMALLAMALEGLGVSAISFTGSQSGIITDESHAQARIIEVRPARILEELAKDRVVIVAGYQGVSRAREVTTLGRGGSDTTAVALAAALEADCEIYSDVDGVFSADPRVVPSAQKLPALSYDEMQVLAGGGAKVLNAQAVAFAKGSGIVIHARSTYQEGTGTRIDAQATRPGHVKAVTGDTGLWAVSFKGPPQALTQWLGERGSRPLQVLWNSQTGAAGEGLLWFSLQDSHGLDALRADLESAFSGRATVLADVGTVTCVGTDLQSDASLLPIVAEGVETLGAELLALTSTPLQITVLTRAAKVKAVVHALHQALIG